MSCQSHIFLPQEATLGCPRVRVPPAIPAWGTWSSTEAHSCALHSEGLTWPLVPCPTLDQDHSQHSPATPVRGTSSPLQQGQKEESILLFTWDRTLPPSQGKSSFSSCHQRVSPHVMALLQHDNSLRKAEISAQFSPIPGKRAFHAGKGLRQPEGWSVLENNRGKPKQSSWNKNPCKCSLSWRPAALVLFGRPGEVLSQNFPKDEGLCRNEGSW